MKRINYLLVAATALVLAASCKNVNYRKTQSGLLYKIFPSNSKDSLIKPGAVVKLNYDIKLNDSTLVTTYDKMPFFFRIVALDKPTYDVQELMTKLKKGDSVVTVQLVDTLMKRQPQQVPPTAKKGDRLVLHMKVMNVFTSDSLARVDAELEKKKDEPRRLKEEQEQIAKMKKDQDEMLKKKMDEWQKSGEIAKEVKEMEAFLSSKKISAQKTGFGTFVHIQEQGTGPAAEIGKYVKVKYTGKFLTDSVFESNIYPLRLGYDPVIQGWVEGLPLFKQGGKGTLYIPGFLAYGEQGGPSPKPFTPLVFDVEILEVSDSPVQ